MLKKIILRSFTVVVIEFDIGGFRIRANPHGIRLHLNYTSNKKQASTIILEKNKNKKKSSALIN